MVVMMDEVTEAEILVDSVPIPNLTSSDISAEMVLETSEVTSLELVVEAPTVTSRSS